MPKLNSSIKERLLKKVVINPKTNCWEWTGFKSGGRYGGYAMIKINNKNRLATRISYEQFTGEIPEGFSILHRCDNPSCINPDHLWAGTQSENMRDMHSKSRHKSSKSRFFMHKNEMKTMAQIAREEKVSKTSLRYYLIKRKVGLEAALSLAGCEQ